MNHNDKFKCKTCDGKGVVQIGPPLDVKGCPICDGVGYLDWIEAIVGKKKKIKPLEFTINDIDIGLDNSFYETHRHLLDEIANKMALDIDKMILNELINKPTKIYGQGSVKNYGRKRRKIHL